MAQPIQSAQKYYPQIDKGVDQRITVHLQRLYSAINDHDQAIVTLNGKVTGAPATTTKGGAGAASASSFATTIINQVGVSSFNTLTGAVSYFPYLGQVNPQAGVTSYTTQQSDAGQEIILNDAAAIAVTLNFNVTAPWFTTLSNQGTGTATITPSQGMINGGASITLPGGSWVTIYFDGANWWSDAPGSTVVGVTQLLAGAGIALSPAGGTGVVTVTVIGAAGSYTSGNNAYGYWQKDPADLIRQWGVVTGGTTGTVVTFPTNFTNAASVAVNTTSLWPGSGSIAFVSVEEGSITTAQFQVAMGVTATQDFDWFAIGY